MRYIFAILVLLSISSCVNEYGFDVDPDVQPFFEIYEQEAKARGISVDLSAEGIGAVIDFVRDNSTVGQCQKLEDGRRILIDKAFWYDYDFFGKEFIVFHELGHCHLDRDHDNSVKPGNICESIMQSGISGCRSDYGPDTREEYLDELFGI